MSKTRELMDAIVEANKDKSKSNMNYWRTIFMPWDIVAKPMWDCEDERNPVGFCVYDTQDDPPLDHCLFCGEPYERK